MLWRTLPVSLILAWAAVAGAQSYPTRPIAMVVAFSAGGPSDTIARVVAERMTRSIGQPVVVENITGAGGTIGVAKVVRANPDGYTLGVGHNGTHVINGAIYRLPYDLVKDLEPVAMIATNPQLFVSTNSVPANNLRELLAWIKDNQTRMSIGSGGVGTPSHLMAEYLNRATGTQPQIVHYRGSAPALQDLIAGHTQLQLDQVASSLPLVRAGKIRAYAVTSRTRLAVAPEIPTVDEAGLPGFYMAVWHGIWAPKGTPNAILAKLNAAVTETLADPALRQRLLDLGQEVPPREQQTPEALGTHHKAEIDKWWPLIKSAGIKAE